MALILAPSAGRSPGPMLWGRHPGAAVLWCCSADTARSELLPSVDAPAGGRHLVPLNSRRKPCPVPCWANNDGACERRFPRWRRCCVVLGDVILPPRRRVAIDVLHLCFPCFGRHPLVWLLSPYVVPSLRHCLWRVVVAWGAALGGAEAKAFACLQADDGDALGRRFPPWRHHSFAPSPFVPHGWSPGWWFILCTCVASFYTLSS